MEKRILKKIAKEWCKAIIYANDLSSFDDDIFTLDEQQYIINECENIANRITKEPLQQTLPNIIKKYYELANQQ